MADPEAPKEICATPWGYHSVCGLFHGDSSNSPKPPVLQGLPAEAQSGDTQKTQRVSSRGEHQKSSV